ISGIGKTGWNCQKASDRGSARTARDRKLGGGWWHGFSLAVDSKGKVSPVFRNPEYSKKIFTLFWWLWNNAASSEHPRNWGIHPQPEAVALKSLNRQHPRSLPTIFEVTG